MTPERIAPFLERARGRVVETAIDLDKMGRGNDWLAVAAQPLR